LPPQCKPGSSSRSNRITGAVAPSGADILSRADTPAARSSSRRR